MKKFALLLLISTSLYANDNSFLNKERFVIALKSTSAEIDLNEKIKFYEDSIGYRNSKHGIFYISYKDLTPEIMILIIKKYNEIEKMVK